MRFDPLSGETLLNHLLDGPLRLLEPIEQELFASRFLVHWPDAFNAINKLYGELPNFQSSLYALLDTVAQRYVERSSDLRQLDLRRMAEPDWFQQEKMAAYMCYTDRFAGDLQKVKEKIPYLQELGITYLHLMPLLKPRAGANDGGYAVQSYHEVNPELGTMEDLADLTAALQQAGISLCIDVVCNHTAKEHRWARQAMAGNAKFQEYYLTYADATIPNQFEETLPLVFPEFKPGNFTYYPEMGRWVWTTFNEYQWDLNYKNPNVFREMLDIILFLANQGAEILRLDAVAFMWKRLGTDSQNQPEAYVILHAFRALSRIVAPALLLKAEAIVSPDKLVHYLGSGRATNKSCELAYHNVFMVLLWSALAERKVVLLTHALQQMPTIPTAASWLTYIRVHDDIGWAITDEDAGGVGLNAPAHRSFLSDFYSGRFPDTFARGATFQFNPKTNDRRISGSLASLAGLETALENEDMAGVETAVSRILMLHALIASFGGTPQLYMGDEIGLLNDYSYVDDPDHADDNRWLHRPMMDWEQAVQRHDSTTIAGQIYGGIRQILQARSQTHTLHAQAQTVPVWAGNDHVFGLLRQSPRGKLLVLANFAEQRQTVSSQRLAELGFTGPLFDRLTGNYVESWFDILLAPYQVFWLERG